MFLLHEPSKAEIQDFLVGQRVLDFSYDCVGVTGSADVPVPYHLDHNRLQIGSGRDAYERAKGALRAWKMFSLPWIQLCWSDAPIESGTAVAVLAKHLGFFSLNACRIVYLVTEENDQGMSRFGFAYGTLPDHAESGEERFTVEFDHETQAVTYDLYALSKPHQLLSRLAYPYTRKMQKRFAADSLKAMSKACSQL